jgi:hypothetical protein
LIAVVDAKLMVGGISLECRVGPDVKEGIHYSVFAPMRLKTVLEAYDMGVWMLQRSDNL